MEVNNNQLFFEISEKLIVETCEEIEGFQPTPFKDFFDSYLNKQILKINDSEYKYEYLIQVLSELEKTNTFIFSSSIPNSFYQIEIVKNHDKSFSMYYRVINNVKNYDNYGKIDYLTQVSTRAFFTKRVIDDFEERKFKTACILMIDLDDFKTINDTFGHNVGDSCLKQVASNIVKRIGDNDFVARYGGDEFIVFLHDYSEDEIVAIIEDLLLIRYQTVDKMENKVNLKLSIGAKIFNVDDKLSLDEHIANADEALYTSKQDGKNTYSIYGRESLLSRRKKNLLSKFEGSNYALFKDEIRQKVRRQIYIIVFTIIILFILALVTSITYKNQLDHTYYEQTTDTMDDISTQVTMTIQSKFDSWRGELEMASALINVDSKEELDNCLIKMQKSVAFDRVGLLLENGNLYLGDETGEYNLSADPLSTDIIINKKSYVGKTYINYIGEQIIFGIPCEIENNDINLKVSGIVGLSNEESFSKLLNSTSFSGKTTVSLVDHDGSFISLKGGKEFKYGYYNNILNLFEDSSNKENYEKFEKNFNLGNTSTTYLELDNEYTVYSTKCNLKLSNDDNIDDWCIVIFVPSSVINMRLEKVMNTAVGIFIIMFVVLSLTIIIISSSRTKLKIKNSILIYVDQLTNNINEKRFNIDAKKMISLNNNRKYCIVYFDILHFKYINETYGMEIGNEIILYLFNIIKNNLKKYELVARTFAERFVALMEYTTDEEVEDKINIINNSLSNKVFKNCLIQLHIHAGVFKITDNNCKINIAVDKANLALDSVDDDFSRTNVVFYNEELMNKNNQAMILEQNQERALENHEFVVYYQAKYNLDENKYSGSEALVRWNDPIKGLVSPGLFIPLFEKNGFIIKLDQYVFEQVCIDLRSIIDSGGEPLVVSINISGKHFLMDNFFDEYEKIINKYNIPPYLIEFEITESIYIQNITKLNEFVDRIHKIGCLCSIDDFGSGYSSLNMFKDFNFDIVKLDRNFFFSLKGFNEETKTIIASLVELSHKLNKKVVAEGIERDDQIEFLRLIKCDYVQGFYYARPVPLEEYIKLLK